MKSKDSILFVLFAVLIWLLNITNIKTFELTGHETTESGWDARVGILFCYIIGFVLCVKLVRMWPWRLRGFRPRVWPFLLLLPLGIVDHATKSGLINGGIWRTMKGFGSEHSGDLLFAAIVVLLLWQWFLWLKAPKETPPKLT
ncbi:MAG: hypothetical protein ABSG50_04890 [Opitutaceae bacterium]|jgi:hypothetical protein